MACFQGLVNRGKPSIYLVYDKENRCYPESGSADRAWALHYSSRYNVALEELEPVEILRCLRRVVKGCVIWDPEVGDTLNIASTMAGLHDVIPVPPDLAALTNDLGIPTWQDLRGRWRNGIEAYRWAIDHLMPLCSDRIVGHVQVPVNPRSPIRRFGTSIRDLLVASKAFVFSVGTTPVEGPSDDPMRRPLWPGSNEEKDLVQRIYSHLRPPALIFGWITTAMDENVYVSTNSSFGHLTLCGMNNSGNFTVHAAIPGRSPRTQKLPAQLPPLERKVYVCFALSDGDALWNINLRMHGEWDRPGRGSIPFGWTFQPLLAELAPGIVEFFVETSMHNDCLVAGPSGAGYFKPSRMPNLHECLSLTEGYMDACGINVIMGLIDEPVAPRRDPAIPGIYMRSLPSLLGCVEGYASTYDFDQAYLEQILWIGDRPWMNNVCRMNFTWQEPMSADKIAATLQYLASREPIRPLFIPMHLPVTNKATYSMCVEALGKLDDRFVVVRPDALMLLLRQAREKGMLTRPAER